MNKKGFTLVELLAVIVVLAIILAIAVPGITGIIRSASISSFESDAKLVLKAIDYQKLKNESFDVTSINKDTAVSLLGLSNDNYQSLKVVIEDNINIITIVGQNKWAGFIACGSYRNIKVVENINDCSNDLVPPVITVLGDNPVSINVGDTYSDAGATASDNKDGDITSNITISGTINPNVPGSYTITYRVTDSAGNTTTETRTVNVIDVSAPVITILGSNPANIGVGSTYTDAGATALDDVDGNVTSKINTTGTVNPSVIGTYTITYTVTDNEGNEAIAARTINVIETNYVYNYTGSTQIFTVPATGTYKIQLWGESGKGFRLNNLQESYAGYVSGEIVLNKDEQLCILINFGKGAATGGYGESGGGATDIRLNCQNPSDFESIKSRIMVAAGAGSAGYNSYVSYQGGIGGNAGGLTGYTGNAPNYNSSSLLQYSGGGGSQTVGGNYGLYNSGTSYGTSGIFGSGGNGGVNSWPGGGGGYYGGGAGGYYHQSPTYGGGGGGAGGGSSFISGHNGCDAISESSTSSNIIHTGQADHYSGRVFTNTVMIDGSGYNWTNVKGSQVQMPKPDGTLYTLGQGHIGNGYVKITFLY